MKTIREYIYEQPDAIQKLIIDNMLEQDMYYDNRLNHKEPNELDAVMNCFDYKCSFEGTNFWGGYVYHLENIKLLKKEILHLF